MWKERFSLLKSIVVCFDDRERTDLPEMLKVGVEDYQAEIKAQFSDVERRNEALLFRSMQTQPSKGCLRSMVADVQVCPLMLPCLFHFKPVSIASEFNQSLHRPSVAAVL